MKRASGPAGILALAGLLFIPPGSLAAPCNIGWGALAWLFLFCTSALRSSPAETEFSGSQAGWKKECFAAALAALTIAVLAWTAWRRGVPGSPLNLGTYAALPFWEILDACGKTGFFLLFAGLLQARPGPARFGTARPDFPARMRRLSWCAFLAAVFVPNPMAAFQAPAVWTVAGDYLFFWTAAGVLYRLPVPERLCRNRMPPLLCCLAGAALLLVALQKSAGIAP